MKALSLVLAIVALAGCQRTPPDATPAPDNGLMTGANAADVIVPPDESAPDAGEDNATMANAR